jgi:hypothetical protein
VSYFPDMSTGCMVASGEHIRAIGWLHPDHPFTKGEVSAEFLGRLKEFVAQSSSSAEALCFGAFGGLHTCEYCNQAHGIRNLGVLHGDLLYVAPEMIVHYIEQHGYCPPADFIAAVLKSPLPDSEEYQVMTEPFWHLHRRMWEQIMEANRRQRGDHATVNKVD